MSAPDIFRWVVLFLDLGALGSLLALYDRIGRFILPKGAARAFLAANLVLLAYIAVEIGHRFGKPYTVRTSIASVALILYLGGVVALYRWFATDEGRKRRHEIINEFAVHELHRLAGIARALEEDPNHVGRYVYPTWYGRIFRRFP